jgi:hypothetical protein
VLPLFETFTEKLATLQERIEVQLLPASSVRHLTCQPLRPSVTQLELKQKNLIASRIIQRLLKENQAVGRDGEGGPEVTEAARKDAAKLLDVLHKGSTTANVRTKCSVRILYFVDAPG